MSKEYSFGLNRKILVNKQKGIYLTIHMERTSARVDKINYKYEGIYVLNGETINFGMLAKNIRDLVMKIKEKHNITDVLFEETIRHYGIVKFVPY